MLADEPTAELDEANERLVLDALHRLRDDFGSTVVVVTHSTADRRGGRPGGRDRRRPGRVTRAPLVRCRGVSVVYGRGDGVSALDGPTSRCSARERVALVGRSGSGKTTLLHVLGGLVAPSSGAVEWKGSRSPRSTPPPAPRFARTASPTSSRAPTCCPTSRPSRTWPSRRTCAGGGAVDPLELLGLVGLADKADHLPAELSGGEQQRVAIARALAQRPELLLCDEPTGHLDSDTAERVLDLIDALQAELGFALVVATHDAGVASRFDRVVELSDGRVRSETVLA